MWITLYTLLAFCLFLGSNTFVENKYLHLSVYKCPVLSTLDVLKKITFLSASSRLMQLFQIMSFWKVQLGFYIFGIESRYCVCVCVEEHLSTLVYKTVFSDQHCSSSHIPVCFWSWAISLYHIPTVYTSFYPISLPPPTDLPDTWCLAQPYFNHVFPHRLPKCSLDKNRKTDDSGSVLRSWELC